MKHDNGVLMPAVAVKAAVDIAKLGPAENRMLFDRLRESGIFTDREIESAMIVTSYFGLLLNPEKNNALKAAMAKQMYTMVNAEKASKRR